MSPRISDHDLTVLVETAAAGMWDSKAAHQGGPVFSDLPNPVRNNIREAALPYVFHATKALNELGYSKPRLVTTVEELEALFQGEANVVLMDEDGLVLQNLVGGWLPIGGRIFMNSDRMFHALGPKFTVLSEGVPA